MPNALDERRRRMSLVECDAPETPDESTCLPAGMPKSWPPQRTYLREEADLNQYLIRAGVLTRDFTEQWARVIPHKTTATKDVMALKSFEKYLQEWEHDTATCSNITTIITHPSYYKIIALGEKALPFIFKSMARGGGPWFVALEAMTAQIDSLPNRPLHHGTTRQLREDWLIWGRKHGFIESEVPIGISCYEI